MIRNERTGRETNISLSGLRGKFQRIDSTPAPFSEVPGISFDRDAVRARTEAATGGPWLRGWHDDACWVAFVSAEGERGDPDLAITSAADSVGHEAADADFIANARTDVPAMLDRIEDLEWALDLAVVAHRELRMGTPEDEEFRLKLLAQLRAVLGRPERDGYPRPGTDVASRMSSAGPLGASR